MQNAVGVSINAMKYVAMSSNNSCGSSVDDKTRDVDVKNTSSLIWSARGGKSLLCANPAAWANAVADPRNLLVMEQANMVALPELVSKLELSTDIGGRPWHTIGDTFSTIANNKFKEIPRVLPGTWTGKLKFETLDGGKVVTKDNQLCVSDPDEGTIFYIVDAEMKRQGETDPQMPQLYADHPIFLIPGKTYARQSSAEGGQSAGLWVDPKSNDEKIRTDTGNVCRWSLRLGDALPNNDSPTRPAQWVPDRMAIRHNAEVGLSVTLTTPAGLLPASTFLLGLHLTWSRRPAVPSCKFSNLIKIISRTIGPLSRLQRMPHGHSPTPIVPRCNL